MDAKEKRILVSLGTVTAALSLSVGVSFKANVLLVRLDAIGGLIELVVLAITFAALRRAKAAPNDSYNYGLAKLENLCGLLFSQVQFVYLLVFAWLAFNRLLDPIPPRGAGWSVLLYAYGVAVTGAMMRWTEVLNRTSPSPVAESLWRGYEVKFWANMSTVAAVSLATVYSDQPFAAYLDPIAVLALCGLRLRNIYKTFLVSGRDLLDAAAEEHTLLIILRELAANFDHYDDLIGYTTRRAPGSIFITIHLGFAPHRTLSEVFDVAEQLTAGIDSALVGAQVAVVPHRAVPMEGCTDTVPDRPS